MAMTLANRCHSTKNQETKYEHYTLGCSIVMLEHVYFATVAGLFLLTKAHYCFQKPILHHEFFINHFSAIWISPTAEHIMFQNRSHKYWNSIQQCTEYVTPVTRPHSVTCGVYLPSSYSRYKQFRHKKLINVHLPNSIPCRNRTICILFQK